MQNVYHDSTIFSEIQVNLVSKRGVEVENIDRFKFIGDKIRKYENKKKVSLIFWIQNLMVAVMISFKDAVQVVVMAAEAGNFLNIKEKILIDTK